MAELNEDQLNIQKLLIEKWDMTDIDAGTIAGAENWKDELKIWKNKEIEKIKTYTEETQTVDIQYTDENWLKKTGTDRTIRNNAFEEAQGVLLKADRLDVMVDEEVAKELPPGTTVGPMVSVDNLYDQVKTNVDALDYDLLLRLKGIDSASGADDEVRRILSFSFRNMEFQRANLKLLLKNHYISEGMFTEEQFLKNSDAIQVEPMTLLNGKEVLLWRITNALGGDDQLRPVNPPGMDKGDWGALQRGSLEFGATFAAFLVGSSAGSPVVGGPLAAGLARWAMGVTNDMIGKNQYGLLAPSDQEIRKHHITPALIEAGFGMILMKLFQMIKFASMGEFGMKQSDIRGFIKDYTGANPAAKKLIQETKDMLVNKYKVSKSNAMEYLAASVAKMFPEANVGYKLAPLPKDAKTVVDQAIKKSKINTAVEGKIIEKLTGQNFTKLINSSNMADVDSIMAKLVAADEKFWSTMTSMQAKNVRHGLKVFKGEVKYNSAANYMDTVGLKMSEMVKTVNSQLDILENEIMYLVKKNNLTIPIGKTLKLEYSKINKILGSGTDNLQFNLIGKVPTNPGKNASDGVKAVYQKDLKIWNKKKSLFDSMGALEYDAMRLNLQAFNKLLKGEQGHLTYNNVQTLKSIITAAEQNSQMPMQQQYFRYLKGVLNYHLFNAGSKSGNKELQKLITQSVKLNNLKTNSMISEIAQSFGYVSRPGVTPVKFAMSLEGENVFLKYFSDSVTARKNAVVLGELLHSGIIQTNKTMANTIQGSAYQFYYENVIKGGMKHADFMLTHGKNMKSLLVAPGKRTSQAWEAFVRGGKSAEKQMTKFYDQWGKDMSKVATYLEIPPNTPITNFTPEYLANQILVVGNRINMNGLKNALGKQGFKSVQNHIVKTMFNETSLKNAVTQSNAYDGKLLLDWVTKNQGMLRQAFGKDFVSNHLQLAKTLAFLQNATKQEMKMMDAGLTGKANFMGLFVDIFYGPLNHRRLILNRMARIYDAFDVDGTTFNNLFNYITFIETAQANFIAGSYPKALDQIIKSLPIKERTTFIKTLRNKIFRYNLPQLWDNRNIWATNVKELPNPQVWESIVKNLSKAKQVSTNVIKKINWSLPAQRVGVEEAIALPERLNNKYNLDVGHKDTIKGEVGAADILKFIEEPILWPGKKVLQGVQWGTGAIADILKMGIFSEKNKKKPETLKIEEKLKEINNAQ